MVSFFCVQARSVWVRRLRCVNFQVEVSRVLLRFGVFDFNFLAIGG